MSVTIRIPSKISPGILFNKSSSHVFIKQYLGLPPPQVVASSLPFTIHTIEFLPGGTIRIDDETLPHDALIPLVTLLTKLGVCASQTPETVTFLGTGLTIE